MAKKGKHITREDRKNAAIQLANRELSIQDSLKKSNLKGVSFENKIRALANGTKNGNDAIDTLPDEIFSGYFEWSIKKDRLKRAVFTELLLHLDKKKCHKLLENDTYLGGLRHITNQHHKFIREIESWRKTSHNPFKQFSSLLRHLFCAYSVPEFLDSAWLGTGNTAHRYWLTALGVGISIRKLNYMPITMTKKVAHAFGTAPANLSVSEALRWAQVMGKGGDKRLASFVVRSRLSRNDFADEVFWDGAITFFINASMFDYEKISELVDYLMAQRGADSTYSIKGRTINSILRACGVWHNNQENMRQRGGRFIWESCNISEIIIHEGKDEKQVTYSILELRSTKELMLEGRKMNHCVATYTSSCYKGKCAIFSVRKKPVFGNEEVLATVEVSLQNRRIVQAKARFNKAINHKAQTLIQHWAKNENLRIH